MPQPENVKISKRDLERSQQIQEQVSKDRHDYEIAEEKHKERQRVYQRIINAQKELRLAEQEARDMEAREAEQTEAEPVKLVSIGKTWNGKEFVDILDTPKVKKPNHKSLSLKNGSWI